ncbi:MFS transporter [Pseudomonas sp. LS44]|uniref:NTP/NDP exchange transporter n=1 Tax=Pseudomonas sp. LS44 TaxID=1357074 RepID=UPI00215B148C|nr:MFS transporter [Pseudomonas sp. LS44]UVE18402.1 MFS transporter [Pseudomonas sp. LS44]
MPVTQRLTTAINARPGELGAALAGFALFFCLFAGYFMLRPIREAMGILGGVENLQWLFTATFVVMLLAVPLFAWLNSTVPRRRYVDWVYGFFILNLLLFAALFQAGDSVWSGRAFYVWISVYNLFVVSVAWSLMADVFDAIQARRLFAFIAAGASCGGLAGPALGALLIERLGQSGLTLLAAALLAATLPAKHFLMTWREHGGAGRANAAPNGMPLESTRQPVSGNPFSGIGLVLRSPYLLAVGAFVILLATASTFLYFEQARLVAERFPERDTQIRVFSLLDFTVQALSLAAQLFIAGRLAERYGLRALLAGVPALVCLGFLALALAPTFAVLAAVMVVRRVGEYAFVRPGREMLFAPLDAQTKYKAKNFIDTVIYRAGDALSAWAKALLDGLGAGVLLAALAGAVCAAVWGGLGWYLGGRDGERRNSP